MILFAGQPLITHLYGYRVCPLPPDARLAPPVRAHADMLAFTYGKKLVLSRDYYETHRESLSPHIEEESLHLTDWPRASDYPNDIGLNALLVGNLLFCNARYTAPEVLSCGAEVVDVAQGYAACSTLVLSDRTVVTADPSIARGAERRNLDVLTIRPGYILLPGYNTGFIGGASTKIGTTVYFFGDPTTHPDFSAIESACTRLGLVLKSLFDGPLTDLGGIRISE